MSTAQVLGALPAFKGCATSDLEAFVRLAPPVRFSPRSVLLEQGAAAKGAFLVLSGHCRAEVQAGDRHLVVGRINPGEVVGELGLFTDGVQRSATVVAEDEVQALLLTPALFDQPRVAPVVAIVERRALATLADRVRKNTGHVRRCDVASGDEASSTWLATVRTSLRKLVGG